MIPTPARYLLRFDDLCPTMSPAGWEQCRTLVEEFDIRPILAVVPDNRDRELLQAPPDPSFWTTLKKMEAAGAAIAVHGYKHLCHSPARSLLNLHRNSEFAGVALSVQREWIRAGFKILRDHGLNPRLWVAPRHGFDRNTLQALRDNRVEYLSDGFARIPHRRGGITWIPQQLWAPVDKPAGLWTICIHPDTAAASEWRRLRLFVQKHVAQFTSLDQIIKEFFPSSLGLSERIYGRIALWRVQRRCRHDQRKNH